MRACDVGEGEICADDGCEAEHNNGGGIDQWLAGDEKQRAPNEAQEQRLADIGLRTRNAGDERVKTDGQPEARHLRPLSSFREKPRRDDDERGLQEFGGLH